MSEETFYCPIEVRAASWHVDPSPAEYCENEVDNDGDFCPRHEPEDDDWTRE